ncbi:MAG: sensor histidine kinase [Myxococcales bacterium]
MATLDLLTRSKGRPKHVRVYWKRGARRSTAFIVDLEAMSRGEHAVAAATARLVSKVVHEGRNPLTSIKLALQTIARSQLEDRLAKRLVIALREMRTSERIFSALAGLVRVSKPTEGADLAEALELAASDVRSELDERGLELQCDISLGEVPRRADAERVRVAVSQLIGILGHGLDKGVVRLAARQVSDGVEVSVEAEPVPSRRPSGMSLSLELAQKIAAEHGGRLVGSAQGFRLIIAA